jgi:hypothetical protein
MRNSAPGAMTGEEADGGQYGDCAEAASDFLPSGCRLNPFYMGLSLKLWKGLWGKLGYPMKLDASSIGKASMNWRRGEHYDSGGREHGFLPRGGIRVRAARLFASVTGSGASHGAGFNPGSSLVGDFLRGENPGRSLRKASPDESPPEGRQSEPHPDLQPSRAGVADNKRHATGSVKAVQGGLRFF